MEIHCVMDFYRFCRFHLQYLGIKSYRKYNFQESVDYGKYPLLHVTSLKKVSHITLIIHFNFGVKSFSMHSNGVASPVHLMCFYVAQL